MILAAICIFLFRNDHPESEEIRRFKQATSRLRYLRCVEWVISCSLGIPVNCACAVDTNVKNRVPCTYDCSTWF